MASVEAATVVPEDIDFFYCHLFWKAFTDRSIRRGWMDSYTEYYHIQMEIRPVFSCQRIRGFSPNATENAKGKMMVAVVGRDRRRWPAPLIPGTIWHPDDKEYICLNRLKTALRVSFTGKFATNLEESPVSAVGKVDIKQIILMRKRPFRLSRLDRDKSFGQRTLHGLIYKPIPISAYSNWGYLEWNFGWQS